MVDPSLARLSLTLTVAPPASGEPGLPAALPKTGRKARAGAKARPAPPVEVTLELGQDMRRLKGAGGDTASVVWRTRCAFLIPPFLVESAAGADGCFPAASLHLLAHVLPHLLFPAAPSLAAPLLDPVGLRESTVLELGSGTGALASALSSHAKRWVASDLPEALRLIEANLKLNGVDPASPSASVEIQEIDWTTYLPGSSDRPRPPADSSTLPDLIFATDVLYHPSLIQPLLATLNFYSDPGRTTTLFVAEFRTEDVIRDWVEAWLTDGGGWEIRRLPNVDGNGGWGEEGRFVGWVGWRR